MSKKLQKSFQDKIKKTEAQMEANKHSQLN